MSDDGRHDPRRAVLWTGKVEFGDYVFECQIWNISLGGAKIRVGLPLLPGSQVTLLLDRFGTFRGKVVWQDDRSLGLHFDADPAIIRRMFGDSVISLGLDNQDQVAAS